MTDMEWQPIETAPKDGTIVLVFARQAFDWNGIHVARWRENERENSWGHKWVRTEYQNLGGDVSGRPTHWMPLPEPPTNP